MWCSMWSINMAKIYEEQSFICLRQMSLTTQPLSLTLLVLVVMLLQETICHNYLSLNFA